MTNTNTKEKNAPLIKPTVLVTFTSQELLSRARKYDVQQPDNFQMGEAEISKQED